MARILIGVSGGIAAYKALELARLATKAGHGVRVIMTATAERFIGAASFEGIVGAPVLTDEFERDPMRGAFPGDDASGPRPDRAPRGGRERRRVPGRAGLGEHDREARRRDQRLDADHVVSGLHGAPGGRPGDERPHVRGGRDAGEPGHPARARHHRDRAGHGRPRLARGVRDRAAAGARASAGRGRGPAARERRSLGRAARPGHGRRAHASRSTRCASSATARAGGWASPSRPRRRAGGRG